MKRRNCERGKHKTMAGIGKVKKRGKIKRIQSEGARGEKRGGRVNKR